MFFAIDLLCPQHGGRFSIAWISATRGVRYANKKEIVNCDIGKLCDEILEMVMSSSTRPRVRLSLSLASRLTNGLAKIYREQIAILHGDIISFLMQVRKPGIQSNYSLMDSDESEKTPLPKPSRKRKRKIVLSVESAPVAAAPVLETADLEIIIDEKELARPAIHQIDSDLITLREEMPVRSLADRIDVDDMGDFGVLGDGLQPPFPESLPQAALLPQQPEAIAATDIVEPPSKKRAIFKEVDAREQHAIPSQAPEEVEVQIVPEVLQSEIQPVVEVQQEQITAVELPQSDVQVADLPQTEAHRPSVPIPKIKSNYLSKIIVKIQRHLVVNINRSVLEERRFFQLWEYENRVPIMLVMSQADDIINLPVIAPFMEETENLEQFIAVIRKSVGSRGSVLRPSGSSLQVQSALTKTIEPSGIPKPSVTEAQAPQESHQLVVPVDVHIPATPPQSLTVQTSTRVHPPLLETTQRLEIPDKTVLPLAESTGISIYVAETPGAVQPPMEIAEHTIEIAAGAAELPHRKEVISNYSPTESQKITVTKNRQRRIRDIIKNWIPEMQGDITIEAVCFPPINRRNIAVVFYDLLTMHKMGYVILNNKPDLLELGIIEKGERMFRKK